MIITALYEAKTYFVIPKAILYYVDKEGNEQKIEATQDEGERKRPVFIQVENDV